MDLSTKEPVMREMGLAKGNSWSEFMTKKGIPCVTGPERSGDGKKYFFVIRPPLYEAFERNDG